MHQQAAVIAALQTQLVPPTSLSRQQAAAVQDTESDTDPKHRDDDHAVPFDGEGSDAQQVVPSNGGRRSGKGGKQGGVAWRTPWFTVRWSGGPHRFL